MTIAQKCASAQPRFSFSPFRSAPRIVRTLAIMLIAALFANGVAFAAQDDKAAPPADVLMRQQVQHRGLNKEVKLVRKDGSEVKGKITAIGDHEVTVQVKQSATPTMIAYSDLAEVKGPGLSTGAKIGIGVGAGVVVVVSIFAIVISHQLNKL